MCRWSRAIARSPCAAPNLESESIPRISSVSTRRIGDAILNTKPDVVMIAGWYSIGLVRALLTCRRHGIPTLYRGDSNLLSGPHGWRRALRSIKTRLLLRQFDGYLSPGSRADEY